MATSPVDYDTELARMRSEWQQITTEPDPVPAWEAELTRMRADVAGYAVAGCGGRAGAVCSRPSVSITMRCSCAAA